MFTQDYITLFCDPEYVVCQKATLFEKLSLVFYENTFSTKPQSSFLSGWQDSNLRPPAPKAGAMTGLRYTPIS